MAESGGVIVYDLYCNKPLCVDLFCGLGGWSSAFLAEGYECVGYDIEAHDYGTGGYPGTLILRDVRSIRGSELKDAAVIVASPPCQEPSYRAMCWKRAKVLTPQEVGLPEPAWWRIPEKASKKQRGMTIAELLEWAQWKRDYPKPAPELFIQLFNECFRIQREASDAAGRYIPMVVENVRGAQKWVGRAQWHYGSFYLWGDVPALMPLAFGTKMPKDVNESIQNGVSPARWTNPNEHYFGRKVPGIKLSEVGFNVAAAQRYREGLKVGDAVKFSQSGDAWFDGKPRDKMSGDKGPAAYGSGTNSRKAASAMIAKIPYSLAAHIAKAYKPAAEEI